MTPNADGLTSRRWTEAGLLAMVVIWGINFVVVKWALDAFEPLAFNAVRHVIASAFMVVVLSRRGRLIMPAREDFGRIIRLGIVGHFAYQMAFVYGIERTRAGNASLMLALVPLFLLVLDNGRGERRTMAWLGALLSVAGVALVSGSTLRLEGAETLLGDLILIGAAGVWALYTLGAQSLIQRYGPIRTTAWTLFVGSFFLFLSGIPSLFHQDWSRVGGAAWAGALFSSLFSIGIAYLLWYRGVQQLGGPRTAIYANLAPVVALIAGAIVLGEILTLYSVVGAVMILGGILFVRIPPAAR